MAAVADQRDQGTDPRHQVRNINRPIPVTGYFSHSRRAIISRSTRSVMYSLMLIWRAYARPRISSSMYGCIHMCSCTVRPVSAHLPRFPLHRL